jgi:NhaA family Na+:H+ antiporter
VDVGLFAFGLVNAGVLLNADAFVAQPTWIILLSLLIGKTFGIYSFTHIGQKFGLQLPDGVRPKQVFALGMIAGIGFTVALFVTSVYVASSGDPAISGIEDSLKLGALLSFSAAPLGYVLSKILKVQRRP